MKRLAQFAMVFLAGMAILAAQQPAGQSDDNLRYLAVQGNLVSCQATSELQGREITKLRKQIEDMKNPTAAAKPDMSKPEPKK